MVIPSVSSTDFAVVQPDVLPACIPLELNIINVLPQVRKTINVNGDMADLVESILTKGQKVPGLVLALTPRQAGQYLKEVNSLWGTKYSLRRLQKVELLDRGSEYYLILVYGHRRLTACKQAQERIEAGEVSDYFHGAYRCDIHFSMSFEEAFSIQLLENTYVAPPKHEQVSGMWRFWRYLKKVHPDLTVSMFARQTGCRPDVVREMLRFCNLPERVQAMIQPDVPGGKASYSLLVQVARKAEAFAACGKPMSDLEIEHLADFLVAKRVRASDYAKQVSEEILHLRNEQSDLFADILSEPIEKRIIRRVAAAEIVQAIIRDIQYLAMINSMMQSGSFGGLSPYAEGEQLDASAEFSPDSPARMAVRLVEALKGAVPDLAEMLRRDEKSDARLNAALSDLKIEEAVLKAFVRS